MADSSPLKGKHAIVTGGSQGIGAAIAVKFVQLGVAGVAITYATNKDAADGVVKKLKAINPSVKVTSFAADVTDPESGPQIAAASLKGLDTEVIDIVVNNAALVAIPAQEPFEKISPKGFTDSMIANTYTPLALIRACFPHLPARNGRIINISSIAGKINNDDPLFTYGASKAALGSFMRSIARKFGKEKLLTINDVAPGAIRTAAMENVAKVMPKELVDTILDRPSAERRMGEPEDVANIVGWLATEESRWVTGQCIGAHGGDLHMLAAQG